MVTGFFWDGTWVYNRIMKRGLLRMRVLNITYTQDWPYSGDSVFRLSNGGQNADILPQNPQGENIWMELLGESLEVTLMNRNPNSSEFGYADVRLTEICKYPEVLHKINVYVSVKDKVRGWLEKDAALMIIELFYSPKQAGGALTLEIVDAELTRDTELLGKMDPYVVIKIGGKDYKTSVKRNAGKQPVWRERFNLPVLCINEKMELRVMDQDTVRDDEVGRVSFSLREMGLISQRETHRALQLVYQESSKNPQPAGSLRISAVFSF